MARQSKLVSPSLVADMKAELQSLADKEPGAKGLDEVITELMPLIRGCRDRGHSWKRIADSLSKFHSDLTLGRLKRLAFELDPSLKGNAPSKGSLIPTLDEKESKESNWPPKNPVDDNEPEDSNWPPDEPLPAKPKRNAKNKAIDFEDEL